MTPALRLLLILVVLLQSGLAAARVHAHPDCHTHTTPHVHTGDLIDLFAPDHDHDHDGDEHDADAVDLSDALAPAQPAADLTAVALAPASADVWAEAVTVGAFPVGLPPATAGPSRPLYLTFCQLTI